MKNSDFIIKLKWEVLNRKWKSLEKEISIFINKNKKIICKWLNKRKLYISDFLISNRIRKDKNNRLLCFYTAIELIKKAEHTTNRQILWKNLYSYEFKWITNKNNIIWVHIKEFKEWKDKILKLTSIFWTNKKM